MQPLDNPHDPDFLLRRALQANAIFSTLCSIAWIVGGEGLARWFGRDASMATDGIVLLVFAALLAILSSRPRIPTILAAVVVLLDLLWVTDAAVKVASGAFSTGGSWVMGAIGLVVLDLAVLQAMGIYRGRRVRRSLVANAG